MNRHQKRLKQFRREERVIQKEAAAYNDIRNSGVHFAIDTISPLMYYVLCKKFGFRAATLHRFQAEFNNVINMVHQRDVSIDALVEDITEETGATVDKKSGVWNFPKRWRRNADRHCKDN